MARQPLSEPETMLPAYEGLPRTIRRIVRDELRPLMERTDLLLERVGRGAVSQVPLEEQEVVR